VTHSVSAQGIGIGTRNTLALNPKRLSLLSQFSDLRLPISPLIPSIYIQEPLGYLAHGKSSSRHARWACDIFIPAVSSIHESVVLMRSSSSIKHHVPYWNSVKFGNWPPHHQFRRRRYRSLARRGRMFELSHQPRSQDPRQPHGDSTRVARVISCRRQSPDHAPIAFSKVNA
jgi:hypothetical protein